MLNVKVNKASFALAAAAVALFLAGFLSGWFSRAQWPPGWTTARPMNELRLGGFDLINPLLECEGAMGEQELRPFRDGVALLVDDKIKSKWASHVSVYFRDMNNGLLFEIGGGEKFSPASLAKVPLMLAYFKWAEEDPGIMKKKLTYVNLPDNNAGQSIKPAFAVEYGKTYTVEDLIFQAIIYSDNNAYFLLYTSIKPSILKRVYTDLGLNIPQVRAAREDYLTVTEYAAFFRILYNASYLNRELSGKALKYLSEVDFKQGIIAGLPSGTVASHKFGELSFGKDQEIKQLHDCGIVYYPGHPYLLCVMTRGESFEYLDDTIREISRTVYGEVDRQYRGR